MPLPIDKFQILNLIGFILNLLITYGGGMLLWFGGKDNSTMSEIYTTLVTPSGYAFSIWSIIFLGEGVFTVWNCLPMNKNSPIIHAMGYWWFIACMIQCGWTLAFSHNAIWAAALLLSSIALSLGRLFFNLHPADGRFSVPAKDGEGPSNTQVRMTRVQWWIVAFAFSVHFGWCICASLVNINVGGVRVDASKSAQYGIAIACLCFLPISNVLISIPKRDPCVVAVGGWALLAIANKLNNNTDGKMQQHEGHCVYFDTNNLHKLSTAATVGGAIHFSIAGVLIIIKIVGLIRDIKEGKGCNGESTIGGGDAKSLEDGSSGSSEDIQPKTEYQSA